MILGIKKVQKLSDQWKFHSDGSYESLLVWLASVYGGIIFKWT